MMIGKPVRRRMFDRRSGVDRRQADARIYWPDRRRGERRTDGDRRGVKSVRPQQRVVGDPRRVALAARDWLRRLTR